MSVCTCAGTAPGYPQHESYCGKLELEDRVEEVLAEIHGRADASSAVQVWVDGNMYDFGESARDVPRLVAALQAALDMCLVLERIEIGPLGTIEHAEARAQASGAAGRRVRRAIAAALEPAPEQVQP